MHQKEKKFVYHRALNSEEAFRDFLQKQKQSKHTLVAEGDICWSEIDGEFITYIHHPDIHGKSLSDEKIVQLLKKDELFTLEKLFTIESGVNFILELKTGRGNIEKFFTHFSNILQQYGVENVLIDAFSIEQLRILKKIMPKVQTSLHTKFIFGKYVAETTFEKPYFRMHKLHDLYFIDTITISYTTTHVKILNLDIDKAYKSVYEAQKSLNLGAVKSLDSFEKALNSHANYIYLRSKEVIDGYTKFL